MVNFNTIPSDIRASGVYAEINAQPKGESYYNRMLVIGHVPDAAKVAAGEYRLASDDLIGDWGNGSNAGVFFRGASNTVRDGKRTRMDGQIIV